MLTRDAVPLLRPLHDRLPGGRCDVIWTWSSFSSCVSLLSSVIICLCVCCVYNFSHHLFSWLHLSLAFAHNLKHTHKQPLIRPWGGSLWHSHFLSLPIHTHSVSQSTTLTHKLLHYLIECLFVKHTHTQCWAEILFVFILICNFFVFLSMQPLYSSSIALCCWKRFLPVKLKVYFILDSRILW